MKSNAGKPMFDEGMGGQFRAGQRVRMKGRMSPTTTIRCKETHDVPYTLRCVLNYTHTLNLERHRDKEGNEW